MIAGRRRWGRFFGMSTYAGMRSPGWTWSDSFRRMYAPMSSSEMILGSSGTFPDGNRPKILKAPARIRSRTFGQRCASSGCVHSLARKCRLVVVLLGEIVLPDFPGADLPREDPSLAHVPSGRHGKPQRLAR